MLIYRVKYTECESDIKNSNFLYKTPKKPKYFRTKRKNRKIEKSKKTNFYFVNCINCIIHFCNFGIVCNFCNFGIFISIYIRLQKQQKTRLQHQRYKKKTVKTIRRTFGGTPVHTRTLEVHGPNIDIDPRVACGPTNVFSSVALPPPHCYLQVIVCFYKFNLLIAPIECLFVFSFPQVIFLYQIVLGATGRKLLGFSFTD